MLLSSKCDTSGCQGCWHQCFLQRPFHGRASWKEVSLVNAIPAPLLWGWARAGRWQQDSRPMVFQSWAAVAPLLPPRPASCLHPMHDATHHEAPCPIRQCQTDADRLVFLQLFFSLPRKGGSGQWGHARNMSLPCLSTAVRGTRRPPCKDMGRAKILVNREAKDVECETWCPQVRGKFPRKSHEASPSAPRTGGRESQELENVQKGAVFLFSLLY